VGLLVAVALVGLLCRVVRARQDRRAHAAAASQESVARSTNLRPSGARAPAGRTRGEQSRDP
jgi:hypothetical protein